MLGKRQAKDRGKGERAERNFGSFATWSLHGPPGQKQKKW